MTARLLRFQLGLVFFALPLLAAEDKAPNDLADHEEIASDNRPDSRYSHEFDPLTIVSPTGGNERLPDANLPITFISPEEKVNDPAALTELISTTPSVSQNGQGGHFQNFSIRGVSRHRVKTLIDDMRITSDRNAGASASFIDPLLIDTAVVFRSPTSTFFGSGALGGAVQVLPKRFRSIGASAGYSHNGNEN